MWFLLGSLTKSNQHREKHVWSSVNIKIISVDFNHAFFVLGWVLKRWKSSLHPGCLPSTAWRRHEGLLLRAIFNNVTVSAAEGQNTGYISSQASWQSSNMCSSWLVSKFGAWLGVPPGFVTKPITLLMAQGGPQHHLSTTRKISHPILPRLIFHPQCVVLCINHINPQIHH